MKKTILIMLAFVYGIANLNAQAAFIPNTGDVEMDGVLTEVNNDAKKDIDAFSKNVSEKFNVAKSVIDAATKTMNPGDVYMAAQVASITKKPFNDVSKSYEANKGKGWGVVAKEMGIKPGSAEFHEMKKSMKSHGNKGHGNEGHGKEGKGKEGKGKEGKGKEGKGKEGKGNADHGNSNKISEEKGSHEDHGNSNKGGNGKGKK